MSRANAARSRVYGAIATAVDAIGSMALGNCRPAVGRIGSWVKHSDQRGGPGEGLDPDTDDGPRVRAPAGEPVALGRELGGDLPCLYCGYNLRGLSIRGVCPECGVGVRATILAVVDPQAAVLRPIPHPRLVSAGLVAWTVGAFVVAVICWLPPLAEPFGGLPRWMGLRVLSHMLIGCMAISAAGAALLIRPHDGIPRWYSLAVAGAVVLYAPVALMLLRLHNAEWPATAEASGWMFMGMCGLAAIFLLLRPTARVLVGRSLLLRSGRVDRQTLLGMAAAAVIAAIGHGLVVASTAAWTGGHVGVNVLGVAVMVIGAALLTLGLLGSVIDAFRIAAAIVRPRRTLREVLRSGIGPIAPADPRRGGRTAG